MNTVERIIFNLIVIHFILLIVIQVFLQPHSFLKNMNKIYLYEGVGGEEKSERVNVKYDVPR